MMLTVMRFVHIRLLIMMTKELLKFSRNSKLTGLTLAANMLIKTDYAATTSHNPMQIVGHH